ncbi:hypothetical protein [Priestia megaterium]|uniref:hypothetical protein n=1 Tax=Priestia megaterium TaxID=1404 RepID=UPI00345785E9
MKRKSKGMDRLIAFFIAGAMVLIILAILMGSYFFGFIGFLRVMGVEYDSYWAHMFISIFYFCVWLYHRAFFKGAYFFNEEC